MGHLLEVRHLTKNFAGVQALRDASLILKKGEIVALIGNNGAGKSTLVNLIAGLEQPDRGNITFDGQDITKSSFQARARMGIALYFQRPRVFRNETCLNNLIVARHGHPGESLYGSLFLPSKSREFETETAEKGLELLKQTGLWEKAGAMAGTLSGGQQKLLYLAMLLMNDPKVLLLDEPFANVSATMITEISAQLRTLADAGRTLLVIEHHISELLAISHRAFLMHQGMLNEYSANQTVALT